MLKQINSIRELNSGRFSSFVRRLRSGILSGALISRRNSQPIGGVVAAIHNGLTQDEETMTNRILKALEHPATMLAHVRRLLAGTVR